MSDLSRVGEHAVGQVVTDRCEQRLRGRVPAVGADLDDLYPARLQPAGRLQEQRARQPQPPEGGAGPDRIREAVTEAGRVGEEQAAPKREF